VLLTRHRPFKGHGPRSAKPPDGQTVWRPLGPGPAVSRLLARRGWRAGPGMLGGLAVGRRPRCPALAFRVAMTSMPRIPRRLFNGCGGVILLLVALAPMQLAIGGLTCGSGLSGAWCRCWWGAITCSGFAGGGQAQRNGSARKRWIALSFPSANAINILTGGGPALDLLFGLRAQGIRTLAAGALLTFCRLPRWAWAWTLSPSAVQNMPVVISLLNSYSAVCVAAAADGSCGSSELL